MWMTKNVIPITIFDILYPIKPSLQLLFIFILRKIQFSFRIIVEKNRLENIKNLGSVKNVFIITWNFFALESWNHSNEPERTKIYLQFCEDFFWIIQPLFENSIVFLWIV